MTNLPQNQKVVESKKKKKKKKKTEKKERIERNETPAKNNKNNKNKIKKKTLGSEMTSFIVLKCNEEIVHEIFPEAATRCAL